jgi:hypothetical protein
MPRTIPPTPELLAEADRLFAALAQARTLLQIGRAYGFDVGLSDGLAAAMIARHGDEARNVVANTAQVVRRPGPGGGQSAGQPRPWLE